MLELPINSAFSKVTFEKKLYDFPGGLIKLSQANLSPISGLARKFSSKNFGDFWPNEFQLKATLSRNQRTVKLLLEHFRKLLVSSFLICAIYTSISLC